MLPAVCVLELKRTALVETSTYETKKHLHLWKKEIILEKGI